jgi:hypothetical protein
MNAIVVTDRAAAIDGMKLVERPEPRAANMTQLLNPMEVEVAMVAVYTPDSITSFG